jgi:hypothetical protein
MYVLLKKFAIPPFRELFWKIKVLQNKEMMSIQSRIPRVKKAGHLLTVLPLIPYKNSSMDKEMGMYIAFELKTRVGQPSDVTKYKKFVRKFKEASPQEWNDMKKDLEETWTQNTMTGGTDRASTVRALV